MNIDVAVCHLDAAGIRRLRRSVKTWYARHGRHLPWRESSDPYRVWISEIMLQQTTVAAVVPYFERFVTRFPTLAALASADEDEVLKQWEGLGYYSRARNIHRAAVQLQTQRRGCFPNTVAELLKLPGIGRYTAGAIISFAFDRPAPIVEANTLRLYTRLLGYQGDPRSTAGQRLLWEFADQILPRQSPGEFNQALMDLGALVCTPETPECSACPLRTDCVAATAGLQAEIPQRAKRPEPTAVRETAVVVRRAEHVLLMRRPPGQRWAGLWDFPRFAVADERGSVSTELAPRDRETRLAAAPTAGSIVEQFQRQFGLQVEFGKQIAELRHTVTRFRITLQCYEARWRAGELSEADESLRWVEPAGLHEFPLSMTGRKLADLLTAKTGF